MAYIQDSRAGSAVNATVDPAFKALRVTMRPPEVQGAFRIAARSGTIAAATAANFQFAFRYFGSGTCLVQSVRLGLNGIAAYTQGDISYTLTVVRGLIVGDTGGTQLTPGNIQKMRSQMIQSQIDARIATTAGLTAMQVGVEDAAPLASIQHDMAPSITNQPMKEFLPMSTFSKALTLTMNEGFRIRNQSAYAATGTCNIVVAVEWLEYAAISTMFF